MQFIHVDEGKLHIVFGITEKNQIKLLHFSAVEFDEKKLCKEPQFIDEMFQLVQVNFSGYDRPYEKHGNKYIATVPGYTLAYEGMKDSRNAIGRKLVITQKDAATGAYVVTTWQFYEGTQIVRMWNEVFNEGNETQTLEYLSTFYYAGIEKEGEGSTDDKMELRICHNGWQKEMNWQTYSFPELGFGQTQPTVYQRTSKTIEVTNTGNWSTKEYLPMGYLANTEADSALYWQIEHNGSWHWEIGDQNRHFYVAVSGPTEIQSHWYKVLEPGDSFCSVPVAVGVGAADFNEAMGELTKYRRKIRRPNQDNEKLPVIFNDYMNCLFGDPTSEKEFPLIDAAAKAGCEYFVIDAGWYAPGLWWDSVGEWQECRERFPNGIREVTDYIRGKGMVPGVWLELEVMGICCEKAKSVPDDWFFVRHGKRVYDRSRYQLDFRNPAVISHVNEVIDRVVNEYGVGYIKMDYNIEPGIGTELYADSVGDGLMQHEKAYLDWLDEVFEKYPDLVIENCGSGGLRIDYALLSRYSIQSTSDQEDYINYATIAANAASGVTPEQAAVWSYPQREGMKEKEGSLRERADILEETVYNMVNTMLLRIHQSGHLAELSDNRFALVKEGIDYYKSIRADIARALPYWPIGTADSRDGLLASALVTDERMILAVWRRGGEQARVILPLAEGFHGKRAVEVRCVYPAAEQADVSGEPFRQELTCNFDFNPVTGELVADLPKPVMARIFEITLR